MRIHSLAWMSAGLTLIAGCVTINIYFPAAAAEKAADKIIDEVWQLKPDAKSAPPAAPASNAAPTTTPGGTK